MSIAIIFIIPFHWVFTLCWIGFFTPFWILAARKTIKKNYSGPCMRWYNNLLIAAITILPLVLDEGFTLFAAGLLVPFIIDTTYNLYRIYMCHKHDIPFET